MSDLINLNPNQTDPRAKPSNSGFLVFSFVMFVLIIVAAILPLYPNDFFPYVRVGQEITITGAIPNFEFMTYTQFGKPVEYPYWLPSLIFFWTFKAGGILLTSIITLACTAIFYTLLWLCLRELKIRPLIAGIVVLLLGLSGASFFITRPQIFAFPFFGFTLLSLILWQKQDNRLIWFLPVVSMLWVNFHGSFIILFFLMVPALIFGNGNRKRLLVVLILALLATLINYYGFGIWKNIFSVVNNKSNQIFSMEFQPTVNNGWQSNIFFGTLLAIPFLTALTKPKIPFLYWIWFLGFGWMALSGLRYVIWFLAIDSIILVILIDSKVERFKLRSHHFQNRTTNMIIGIGLLIMPITLLPGIRDLWWKKAPPVLGEESPIKAVDWLKQNTQLPGELWSDFDSSTYMTYVLQERRMFMTNRMDDFPVEQYKDYKSIFYAQYNWQELLEKYGVNLLMVNIPLQPELNGAVSSSPNWAEVYKDDKTAIFVHQGLNKSH